MWTSRDSQHAVEELSLLIFIAILQGDNLGKSDDAGAPSSEDQDSPELTSIMYVFKVGRGTDGSDRPCWGSRRASKQADLTEASGTSLASQVCECSVANKQRTSSPAAAPRTPFWCCNHSRGALRPERLPNAHLEVRIESRWCGCTAADGLNRGRAVQTTDPGRTANRGQTRRENQTGAACNDGQISHRGV